MNDKIKKSCPDAHAQWEPDFKGLMRSWRDMYDYFDKKEIVVTPTFMRDAKKPWGYQVQTRTRFMREEANYTTRQAAEKAGFEQAFQEHQKQILAGND